MTITVAKSCITVGIPDSKNWIDKKLKQKVLTADMNDRQMYVKVMIETWCSHLLQDTNQLLES
jgi:hypothetical protein